MSERSLEYYDRRLREGGRRFEPGSDLSSHRGRHHFGKRHRKGSKRDPDFSDDFFSRGYPETRASKGSANDGTPSQYDD